MYNTKKFRQLYVTVKKVLFFGNKKRKKVYNSTYKIKNKYETKERNGSECITDYYSFLENNF